MPPTDTPQDPQAPSQAYYELLNYLPDGLVEVSLDSLQVTYLSRMGRRLLGFDEAAEIGPITVTDFAEDPRAVAEAMGPNREMIMRSRAEGTPFPRLDTPPVFELTLKRRDGSTFLGEVSGYLALDSREVPTAVRFIFRDITERKQAEAERERLLAELQEALANVKTLSGLLPICALCKSVRDDDGYWTQIESYIRKHSEADFSHGLCPSCRVEMYGTEAPRQAAAER